VRNIRAPKLSIRDVQLYNPLLGTSIAGPACDAIELTNSPNKFILTHSRRTKEPLL